MTICSRILPSFPVGSCQKVGGIGYGNAGFSSVYEPGIFSFLLFFRAGV